MSEKKEVVIKLTEADEQYLGTTKMCSFYHSQPERFPIFGEEIEKLKEITQNTETDKECSMVWCNSHLEARCLEQIIQSQGYKTMLLCDEAVAWSEEPYSDDFHVVLSTKPFMTKEERDKMYKRVDRLKKEKEETEI